MIVSLSVIYAQRVWSCSLAQILAVIGAQSFRDIRRECHFREFPWCASDHSHTVLTAPNGGDKLPTHLTTAMLSVPGCRDSAVLSFPCDSSFILFLPMATIVWTHRVLEY